jgi:hypothetical protein
MNVGNFLTYFIVKFSDDSPISQTEVGHPAMAYGQMAHILVEQGKCRRCRFD